MSVSESASLTHGNMPLFALRLFGGWKLTRCEGAGTGGAELRPRSRTGQWLLALLALRAGQDQERTALAALLWPEAPDERTALANLRRTLTDLRRLLGQSGESEGPLLSPTPFTLRFDPGYFTSDVATFSAAVSSARQLAVRNRESAETAWRLAVEYCTGELLPGCDALWISGERARFESDYLEGLDFLARAALGRGEGDRAATCARQALALDPLRESALRLLLEALASEGSLAAAQAAFRDFRIRLHGAVNTEPDPQTFTLMERLRHRVATPIAPAPEPAPAVSVPEPTLRLPEPMTSFVGRAGELAEIVPLLIQGDRGADAPAGPVRLLTLTGVGGTGKTRLSLEIARRTVRAAPERFSDGAHFVDLAPLGEKADLWGALRQVLERGAAGGDAREAALAFLQKRRLLLLLDNAEHLIPACGALSAAILARCPNVTVLVTSRQPLGISGETVWRVPTLAWEARGGDTAEAVRLFVARARALRRDFDISPGALEHIARLCGRLDGLPLAIELAAAWAHALAPAQMDTLLSDRFRLLSRRAATHAIGATDTDVPRQQTLYAAIAWSYELLSTSEQRLLRRLAVFTGGWTLEAARAVCRGRGLPRRDILPLLSSLIDKSLVSADRTEDAGEYRYRFLETVHAFARERLRDDMDGGTEIEEAWLRRRYALYFARRVRLESAERPLSITVVNVESGYGWGSPETPNLEAVWQWAQRQSACDSPIFIRVAAALFRCWGLRHLAGMRDRLEGMPDLLERVSQSDADSPALRIAAGFLLGMCAQVQRGVIGDFAAAQSLFDRTLALWETLIASRPRRSATVLREYANMRITKALVYYHQGEPEEARRRIESAIAWAEAAHLPQMMVMGYHLSGYAEMELLGNHAFASESYSRAEAIARRENAVRDLSELLAMHGYVEIKRGDLARAEKLFTEGMAAARGADYRWGIVSSLCWLAVLAYHGHGDLEQALLQSEEDLALLRAMDERTWVAQHLPRAAFFAAAAGKRTLACAHLAEAERFARETGQQDWVGAATLEWAAGIATVCDRAWEQGAVLVGAWQRFRDRRPGMLLIRLHKDIRRLVLGSEDLRTALRERAADPAAWDRAYRFGYEDLAETSALAYARALDFCRPIGAAAVQ